MKTIKAVIIDDEKHALDSLKALIEIYCPTIDIIGTSFNIQDGKQIIEKLNPDLVFLDISIGEHTGFELLLELQTITFELIFTTAFSEFALKAFRFNALDYLLKPIDPNELKTAVKKVEASTNKDNLQQQLTQLVKTFQSNKPQQLTVRTKSEIHFLPFEEILHVEGSANYVTFYLEDGRKITASKGLKYFENQLPNNDLSLIHISEPTRPY